MSRILNRKLVRHNNPGYLNSSRQESGNILLQHWPRIFIWTYQDNSRLLVKTGIATLSWSRLDGQVAVFLQCCRDWAKNAELMFYLMSRSLMTSMQEIHSSWRWRYRCHALSGNWLQKCIRPGIRARNSFLNWSVQTRQKNWKRHQTSLKLREELAILS